MAGDCLKVCICVCLFLGKLYALAEVHRLSIMFLWCGIFQLFNFSTSTLPQYYHYCKSASYSFLKLSITGGKVTVRRLQSGTVMHINSVNMSFEISSERAIYSLAQCMGLLLEIQITKISKVSNRHQKLHPITSWEARNVDNSLPE